MSLDSVIEVPTELQKKAAGRIYRNELRDPIGGIDPADGKLKVYQDYRWEAFINELKEREIEDQR